MSNVTELKAGEIDIADPFEHAAEIRKRIAKITDHVIAVDFELRLFALLQLNMEIIPPDELETE